MSAPSIDTQLVAQCDLSAALSNETGSLFQYGLSEPSSVLTKLVFQLDLSAPLSIETEYVFQYGLSEPPASKLVKWLKVT